MEISYDPDDDTLAHETYTGTVSTSRHLPWPADRRGTEDGGSAPTLHGTALLAPWRARAV
jgi:hypothetical protein